MEAPPGVSALHPWEFCGANGSRNLHQREAQGGRLGPGMMWRGKDGVRAMPFGSGCWAQRSWTLGNDLKGSGNRAGYLVLKTVSKNLPLLLFPNPNELSVQCFYLPASSSAPASSQDCPWTRAGKWESSGEGGQAKKGVTLGSKNQLGGWAFKE